MTIDKIIAIARAAYESDDALPGRYGLSASDGLWRFIEAELREGLQGVTEEGMADEAVQLMRSAVDDIVAVLLAVEVLRVRR